MDPKKSPSAPKSGHKGQRSSQRALEIEKSPQFRTDSSDGAADSVSELRKEK